MRRELLWALTASALLSAWVLLGPGSGTGASKVVAPVERTPVTPTTGVAVATTAASGRQPNPQGAPATLPATWPAPNMESAPRSPFASAAPPAPKPLASAAVATPAPPPPPPPQVTYRFWGSLTAPDGERVLYIARDDNAQPTAIHVGTRLDGGFEVEQITAAAIVLVQSGSQQRVTLSMSPPATVGAH